MRKTNSVKNHSETVFLRYTSSSLGSHCAANLVSFCVEFVCQYFRALTNENNHLTLRLLAVGRTACVTVVPFLLQGSLLGISEDVKEQLSDAATHTGKAYAAVRRGRDPDAEMEPLRPLPSASMFGADMQSSSGKHEVKTMSPEVLVMKPILRFLQLLCENHNRDLQVSGLMKWFPVKLSWHYETASALSSKLRTS